MLILDRFEENIVIIERTDDETGEITMIKTEKNAVDHEAKEGDVLICDDGLYVVDNEATAKRRDEFLQHLKK